MSDAVAAGASVVGGIMGFKGNRAAAKNAEAIAEYNARVAENEKILLQRAKVAEEANLVVNSPLTTCKIMPCSTNPCNDILHLQDEGV